jgi:hypothetical protein
MSGPDREAAAAAAMAAGLQALAGFAQVNLLEEISVSKDQHLPWWAPAAAVGVVVSAALGSALQLNPLVSAQKARITAVEAQVLEQSQRIDAAARLQKNGTVAEQVQALQAALAQQERTLLLLGGGVPPAVPAVGGAALPLGGVARPAAIAPTSQAFSAQLEGLSHTRVEGVWLSKLRLDRRTQEVRLEGLARDARLVSTYIDELSRNPRFKGLVLATVEVARPAVSAPVSAEAAAAVAEPASFRLVSAAQAAPGSATTPGAAGAANPPGASRPGATP